VAARRDFLKLSALGAVAGAVATGTPAQASEVKTVSNGDYQETDHVKSFYESARF
jgi:anaerobic selenocysteine-containing dehydrogenase